jgi:hypothetical protein
VEGIVPRLSSLLPLSPPLPHCSPQARLCQSYRGSEWAWSLCLVPDVALGTLHLLPLSDCRAGVRFTYRHSSHPRQGVVQFTLVKAPTLQIASIQKNPHLTLTRIPCRQHTHITYDLTTQNPDAAIASANYLCKFLENSYKEGSRRKELSKSLWCTGYKHSSSAPWRGAHSLAGRSLSICRYLRFKLPESSDYTWALDLLMLVPYQSLQDCPTSGVRDL